MRLIPILALLCALLAGCAAPPRSAGPVEPLFDDAAFAPPAVPIDVRSVLQMTPAMRRFLDEQILPRTRGRTAHRNLLDALYAQNSLKLRYDTEHTRTAAEAFEARAGNCLSLVLMTATFADALELPVRFQEVRTGVTWARDGDLVLVVGHVNIAVGRALGMGHPMDGTPEWYVIDFLPGADLARQHWVPLERERVLSMYLNNKAAEALGLGRIDEAYAWARAAVRQDPSFGPALNTLAVVYLRRGLPAHAEAALRHLLVAEPESPHALGNLAQALYRQGRAAEAAEATRLAEKHAPESPFTVFDQGQQALARGDLAAARRLIERALRLGGDFHEFRHALAQVLLRQGEPQAAMRHLEAALEASTTPQLQMRYAGKLERLRTQLEH